LSDILIAHFLSLWHTLSTFSTLCQTNSYSKHLNTITCSIPKSCCLETGLIPVFFSLSSLIFFREIFFELLAASNKIFGIWVIKKCLVIVPRTLVTHFQSPSLNTHTHTHTHTHTFLSFLIAQNKTHFFLTQSVFTFLSLYLSLLFLYFTLNTHIVAYLSLLSLIFLLSSYLFLLLST